MRLRQALWGVFLAGSLVYASFFGGAVAYGLLFAAILTPLAALLYNLFVYLRFKIFQQIESRSVVKGEMTPFTLVLANEDYMAFQSLSVDFFTGTSTIHCPALREEWCLSAQEQVRLDATLCCGYRGEYRVGVQNVRVRDYFGLFSLTYPIRGQIKAQVLPRVLELSRLNLLPEELDAKRSRFAAQAEEETPDTETRPYVPGDSPRDIHWKLTARQGELYVRRRTSDPKTAVVLCMDVGLPRQTDQLLCLRLEDQVVEAGLAVARYCLTQSIRCQAVSGAGQVFPITSQPEFDYFYQFCGGVRFDGGVYLAQLLDAAVIPQGAHCVAVTHTLTPALYTAAHRVISGGSHLAVVLAADPADPQQDRLAQLLGQLGVQLCVLREGDDLALRLTQEATA